DPSSIVLAKISGSTTKALYIATSAATGSSLNTPISANVVYLPLLRIEKDLYLSFPTIENDKLIYKKSNQKIRNIITDEYILSGSKYVKNKTPTNNPNDFLKVNVHIDLNNMSYEYTIDDIEINRIILKKGDEKLVVKLGGNDEE
ncbi:MAG: hypothetical protein NC822_06950, partial [Candidatus Omnitrophica bacterium]|nr:hypothetical protein [Candidatus Omnitrophota bacterium]